MFTQTYLPSDLIGYIPASSRNRKLTAANLSENVICIAYNSGGGVILKKGNTEGVINTDYGHIGVFLKPNYNSNTGVCQFGQNTSNDPDQNYYSATLNINFSDSPPAGIGASLRQSSPAEFYTSYLGLEPDYFLDLKALSGGKRYCHIQVQPDSNNTNHALIEGRVNVVVPTSTTAISQSLVQIWGSETPGTLSSDRGGLANSRVTNRDCYIDLKDEAEAYMFAMINFAQHRNGFSFNVGDPKDDGDIQIDEV